MPKAIQRPRMEALPEDFVRVWGEAITQIKAANILDVKPVTISRMVSDGRLQAAPNGTVIVRSIHAYLYSLPDRTLKIVKPQRKA